MTQVTDTMTPVVTGITFQEWIKTLPQAEQDEFAAAEARRVALVNAAVAAGMLTVDADDDAALAALNLAIKQLSDRNPNATPEDYELLAAADPSVVEAQAQVDAARATPMYTWVSEEARNTANVTDPVWLTFWDRWAANNTAM